jgi:hypothetical protein
MSQRTRSPLAGQTVKIRADVDRIGGQEYRVEDWWISVFGGSWMDARGNPAALAYAVRTAGSTPIDDEVLYGKIGGLGFLVHVSEIEVPQ